MLFLGQKQKAYHGKWHMHQSSIIQCAHVMGVPPGGETRTNPSHPNPPSLLLIHCTIVEWHMYLYTR